jgi:hypothetical protein
LEGPRGEEKRELLHEISLSERLRLSIIVTVVSIWGLTGGRQLRRNGSMMMAMVKVRSSRRRDELKCGEQNARNREAGDADAT